ncbi:UBA/THIF-type NAD/FAD binding protein [Denitrovibrio acetiphilus DSM 12809]|uniref:UBA/THIF-type NAD/FAD binding protein n=1 Tax=Denitrovibrio acetiphilus (strain DSM 12809 / NBRC 114555 / N2460) TaxID=522772 RepID=D4H789_DENA2|nr:HesA/MoeB/ThiF family protein [Denitrovibrio acetiphilus]ADD67888.1 UBA/THIF-type NAD/FAD binding protein [Denitrovibrio acetiphilus DSM 12809]
MHDYYERYKRQIMLKDFGREKQDILKNSSVFIGGIGGLGGATAAYLASAGIGRMVISHYGNLTESNMNRQHLMDVNRIGEPRIDIAVENILKINPDIELEMHNIRLNENKAEKFIEGCDVAVSARPNFPERMAMNNACVKLGVPMIEAAMDDMVGYYFNIFPHETACLRCFVSEDVPDWKELGFGVLGAVSGTIGSLAAVEAVKIITKHGTPLKGKMMHIDFNTMRTITPKLKRNPDCPVCGRR